MPDNHETTTFTIEEPGERLDRFLTGKLAELSRTRVQKLISEGYVTVNAAPSKSGYKLEEGDVLSVTVPPEAPTTLEPEDIDVPILYEDDDVIVVDKPAGLTVHPAPGHASHTLVNALLAHLPSLPDTGDQERPGIVHRLDKDTSGAMIVAKTSAAHRDLSAQFKARTTSKTYRVLVKGKLVPEDGTIEAPIGRDSGNREKMAVVSESRGREARTDYHVLGYHSGYTYLEIYLMTGRTHQIRVHLGAIGFPVVGDKVYGVKVPFLDRQFVHAWKLAFDLPSTGERMEFTAPLPPDLLKALRDISG